jgi:hypothetical protein
MASRCRQITALEQAIKAQELFADRVIPHFRTVS